MLRDILENKGYIVKIILSSTWRLGYDKSINQCSPQVQKLIYKLTGAGISIYDKTPIYKEYTRDVEINHYIRRYELENKDFTYIILDDDTSVFDDTALKNMNFYKVNEYTGLVISDISKITKMIR